MDDKTGGPAFPRFVPDGHYNGSVDYEGMTLRDWFAGRASEADIDAHQDPHNDPSDGVFCYRYSREQARYRYADAMIEARK